MQRMLLLSAFGILGVLPLPAQEVNGSATFEVASVKPAAPQTGGGVYVGIRGGPGTQDPTRISYVNQSLRTLLGEAYAVKLFQVSGPEWIDTVRFDILATVAPGSTKEQVHMMLRNLLSERFHMTIHHESREFPVFELTVAKSGPKLTSSSSETPTMNMMSKNGQGHLTAVDKTITNLAGVIETEVGTSVLDKTGLAGKYDFTLDFARDSGRVLTAFKGISSEPAATTEPSFDSPGLSTALQDQLGLQLTRSHGMLDVIVLDRADKTPTDN